MKCKFENVKKICIYVKGKGGVFLEMHNFKDRTSFSLTEITLFYRFF
jgi:hypothetical protein